MTIVAFFSVCSVVSHLRISFFRAFAFSVFSFVLWFIADSLTLIRVVARNKCTVANGMAGGRREVIRCGKGFLYRPCFEEI